MRPSPARTPIRRAVLAATLLLVTVPPAAGAAGPLYDDPVVYPTGLDPHAVTVGDLDGDGELDLVVTNSHADSVSVLRGTGSGTFRTAIDATTGLKPKSAVVDDFDEDGDLDVATANQDSNTASILLGKGDGRLGTRHDVAVCTGAHEITTGDFDGDHDRDLAVACWGGSVVAVLLGKGDGTFQAKKSVESGAETHSLAVRDLDGDGHDDLVVANHGADDLGVLLGKGDGTFKPVVRYPVGDGPHSVRIGDLDLDGHPDIVAANAFSDSVSVLIGDGDGTFAAAEAYPAGSVPKGVAVADVDGDGDLDILAADTAGNGEDETGHPDGDVVTILRNGGDGRFGAGTPLPVGPTPFAVQAADFDGDGRLDLAASLWDGGGVAVLRNIGAARAFTDIARSSFRLDILWLRANGITTGCGGTMYCPASQVSRGQMATFLARALHLPAATRDWFKDDETNSHEADIDRLAEAGITKGCGSKKFCPDDKVSRGQMASFLARAFHLPAASKDYFKDDQHSSHESNINRVAKAGITSGCAANKYCPTSIVTRGQMARFLHKAMAPD